MDLETAVADLAPGLLRYCLGRTGDRALAEELAQEALAALVGRWRRLGPPDSPQAFTFGIARRRAGRAMLRRRLTAPLAEIAGGGSDDPGPDARAESRAELAAVVRALRRLPARDREALLLVAAGEVPQRQAAAVLGVSLPALKMRVHRARRRLGELVGRDRAAVEEEVPDVLERA